MLRATVIAVGALLVLGGAGLAVGGAPIVLAIYLVLAGLVMIGGIAFERYHYRPDVDRMRARWVDSGERFVDPTTGRLMQVRYDPESGRRDYVDIGPAESKPGSSS